MAVDVERIRSLIEHELRQLKAPPRLFEGFLDIDLFAQTQDLAQKLGDIFLSEFSRDSRFLQGDPVLLGSWARGQMSPKSDLDLGFWTGGESTESFIRELQMTRLPIRARILTSQDILTWPLPEQMAFLEHRALTERAAAESLRERERLTGASLAEKKKWIRILKEERDQRHARGFEFENVLEPHLKTGRGGLRDIQQAFHLFNLMPDLWQDEHFRKLMQTCLWFYLTIRFELHRLGAGDFLQAALQIEVAKRLGYGNFKDFMREVQRSLSRVAFYSDVMFEWALTTSRKRQAIAALQFETGEQLVRALKKDPSLLIQYQARRQMDRLITSTWIRKNSDLIDEYQGFLFFKSTPEKFLRAAFRSRLLDQLDPRLRALVGYNQHDQYHAFTAETHILNLLLGLKAAVQKPRSQGLFARYLRELTARDEHILAWACYYHDLAKGQGGDHEEVGEKWVYKDGKERDRSEVLTEEVAWLVRHHLEFSKAAFREDPRSEKTWQRLYSLGLNPGRIRRLILFTALDIQATHPKAWTPWKEKLLFELAQNLLTPARLKTLEANQKIQKDFLITSLTLPFLESVTPARVSKDLKRLRGAKAEAGFRVEKVRGGFWVRYFDPVDAPGVLVRALKSLFAVGASVQEAWVHTLPRWGVYDWFFVASNLSSDVFERRLLLMDPMKVSFTGLYWDDVQIERPPEPGTWILHLKGKDQRGLLVWTVEAITRLQGNIVSARIQTWGERAEDRLEVHWPVELTGEGAGLLEFEGKLKGALLGSSDS